MPPPHRPNALNYRIPSLLALICVKRSVKRSCRKKRRFENLNVGFGSFTTDLAGGLLVGLRLVRKMTTHANFRSFISLHCRRSSRQVRFWQSSLPDDAAVAGSKLQRVRDTRHATAFSLDRILRTSRDLPVALKCRSCLPCAVGQITGISPRVPCPWIEGRFAIVTERWARNAMDALAACDERGRGGRRSRVVLISRR